MGIDDLSSSLKQKVLQSTLESFGNDSRTYICLSNDPALDLLGVLFFVLCAFYGAYLLLS